MDREEMMDDMCDQEREEFLDAEAQGENTELWGGMSQDDYWRKRDADESSIDPEGKDNVRQS